MIVFNNVTKVYANGTRALSNVDLEIGDGEFVFVVGASGAGKTTLTKLLLCEEKPSGGKITIGRFNLTRMPKFRIPKLRRTIGIVFQDFRLLPNMTASENIAFAMHVVGESKKKIKIRVANFLKLVGLEDKADCKPSELSGGEKQRVALARALVNNPDVIIADEPTANVDPYMAIEIMELLLKINQLGKTVIVITHNISLVNYYQKRVIAIKKGKIFADHVGGISEDLLNDLQEAEEEEASPAEEEKAPAEAEEPAQQESIVTGEILPEEDAEASSEKSEEESENALEEGAGDEI